jgi:uncharacterized protein YdaU (DUF1376 family)
MGAKGLTMGKAPAAQFYFADFIRDTTELSLAAIGAWMLCLCKMWFSPTRGRISMPISGYARMFGCSVEEAKAVIDEISDLGIGDAVTESNGNVTLANRRMVREQKEREGNNYRAQKYRNKNKMDPDPESNADVTKSNGPSSSSSSSNFINTKESHAREWTYPVKDLVDAFPHLDVTAKMAGFIENAVMLGDEVAWEQTIQTYLMNYDPQTKTYLPEKTANLLSVFKNEKTKLKKGKSDGSNFRNFREQREQEALQSKQRADAIRRELAEPDGEVPQADVPDRQRLV